MTHFVPRSVPAFDVASRPLLCAPALLLCVVGLAPISCVAASGDPESGAPENVAEAQSPITIFQSENPGPADAAQLGTSVATADGDWAAVGAPNESSAGRVHVYNGVLGPGLVTYQKTLSPPAGAGAIRFGQAVSVSNFGFVNCNFVAVGAPGYASNRGIVYVYAYDQNTDIWSLHSQVEPPNGAAGDQFGFSVDIACGTGLLLVGAPYHTNTASNPGEGAVYGYKLNGATWQLENVLHAPDGAGGDHFGWTVRLGGADNDTATYAYIGAPHDDGTYADQGSVHVYRQPGFWTYKAKITPPDPVANLQFGISLDQEQPTHRLVIGAPGAVVKALLAAGTVYEYSGTQSTWTLLKKHFLAFPAANDQFGFAVATNESELLVTSLGGVGRVHHYNMNGGATYTYQASVANPNNNTTDGFGRSVAAGGHGHIGLIGAPRTDVSGYQDAGIMHVASF